MSDNSLASPNLAFPTLEEWRFMLELGDALVKTGFMPRGVDTAAKAAAIMLKGRELGVPPMEAIANIYIVNGKPSIQTKLMVGMVKRAYGHNAIWVEETTDEKCTVGYISDGRKRYYTFTIEDARRAGLTEPGTYKDGKVKESMYVLYPGPMLRARCLSAVCVMEFPHITGGLYAPGEMGEPVTVDSSGEIIVDPQPASRTPQPAQDPKPLPEPAKGSTDKIVDHHVPQAEPVPVTPPRHSDNGNARSRTAESGANPDQPASPTPQRKRQPAQDPDTASRNQMAVKVADLGKSRGISKDSLTDWLFRTYGEDATKLGLNQLRDAYEKLKIADSTEFNGK